MSELIEDMNIVNPLGLHARPAAALVRAALAHECEVFIQANGRKVNAKSIMGVLTLAASQGTTVTVTCIGPGADEAMAAMRALIASGFGEEDD